MVAIDLGNLLLFIFALSMMRKLVMPFGDSNLRISAITSFVGKHKRNNSCAVGLQRERVHVEHQTAVLVELFGNSGWSREFEVLGICNAKRICFSETVFDFSHRVHVLV